MLCLLDRSRPLEEADHELLARLDPARTLVLASKADLPPAWDPRRLDRPVLPVAATTGDGLDALRDAAERRLLGDAAGSELWITHERHADALARVEIALARAADAPEDLMALDLQEALETLASLTGRGEIAEEALAHVFANFCVGK